MLNNLKGILMNNFKLILPICTSLLSVSLLQADLVTGSTASSSENFVVRSVLGQSGLVASSWKARLATRSATDFDNDGIDDIFDLDDDNDGMPDTWELQYGLNPTYAADADQDKDGDGISNAMEYGGGIDPTDPTDRNSLHTAAEYMVLAEQAIKAENLLGAYLNSQAAAKLDASNVAATLMEIVTSFGDLAERPDAGMASLLSEWQVEYDRNVFTTQVGTFSKAEEFVDANKNGVYDDGEAFIDNGNDQNWSHHPEWQMNGQWDHESFNDNNGNGWFDAGIDSYVDSNLNGQWDYEYYYDVNGNGIRDLGETFTDINGDGLWNSRIIPETNMTNNATVDQLKTSLEGLIDNSLIKVDRVLPQINSNWNYTLTVDQLPGIHTTDKTVGKLDVMAAKSGLLVAKGLLDFISAYDFNVDLREVTHADAQLGETMLNKYGSFFTIRNGGNTATAGVSFKAAAILAKDIAMAIKNGSETQGFVANEIVDPIRLDDAISYLGDFIAGMDGTAQRIDIDEHNDVLINIKALFNSPLNRTDLPKDWKAPEVGETEKTMYDFDSFSDPSMNGILAEFDSNADLFALHTLLNDNYQQAYIPFAPAVNYGPLEPNAELTEAIIISSNVSNTMFYETISISVDGRYYNIAVNTDFVIPVKNGESLSISSYNYNGGSGTVTVKHTNGTVIQNINYGSSQTVTISSPQTAKPILVVGGENDWGSTISDDEFDAEEYLTKYNIYRKTLNPDSDYQLVTSIYKTEIPASGLKSWTDNSTPAAGEYKYLVKPVFTSAKDGGSADYAMNEVGFYHPLSLENSSLVDGTVMYDYNQTLLPTGGQGEITIEALNLPKESSALSSFTSTGTSKNWRYSRYQAWDLDLPFSFSYFGREMTKCKVDVNGRIVFPNKQGWYETTYDYSPSDSELERYPIIAPFWSSYLRTDYLSSDNIFVTSTSDSITIRWQGCYYYSTSYKVNFSTTLYKNGDIKFSYGSGNNYNTSSTIIALSSGDGRVVKSSRSGQNMNYASDVLFKSQALPAGLTLVDNTISGVALQEVDNFMAVFKLTDSNNHSTEITLPLTILSDDVDNDGLSDKWETTYFDSTTSQDGNGDYDGDGLTNSQEYSTYFTNPSKSDTDGDGMSDAWEVQYALDPTDSADKYSDSDGDGIPAWLEAREGLNPTVTDNEESAALIATLILRPGWNMVAIPFKDPETTYAEIFEDISLGSLWIWNSKTQIYDSGNQHALSPTQGVWIFTDIEITVPILEPGI